MRGLWEVVGVWGDRALEKRLHHHLNFFLQDPHQFGYRSPGVTWRHLASPGVT